MDQPVTIAAGVPGASGPQACPSDALSLGVPLAAAPRLPGWREASPGIPTVWAAAAAAIDGALVGGAMARVRVIRARLLQRATRSLIARSRAARAERQADRAERPRAGWNVSA